MAFKSHSLLFVSLMVVAMAAAPMAEAQPTSGNLVGLIKIDGLVRCSVNASTTTAPAFPNALVQLQCEPRNVVSIAITDHSGLFSILLDSQRFNLSTILTSCNLVVVTPLSNCNITLPVVGNLISTLQFIGNTVLGVLNITNIVPTGFNFVLNL